MELDFEGAPYFVSIPDGVAPGQTLLVFYNRLWDDAEQELLRLSADARRFGN